MTTTKGRSGQSSWGLVGCLIFLVLLANWASKFGQEWDFGRYGMPRSLVAPDGLHYQSGAEINQVTLSMIRAGQEEEYWLAILGVPACLIAWWCMDAWRCCRKLAAIEQLNVLMAEIGSLQAKGDHLAASAKLRLFEREYPRVFKRLLPGAPPSDGR